MRHIKLAEGELEQDGRLGTDFSAAEFCDDMLEEVDGQLKAFGLEIVQVDNVGDTNYWFAVEKILPRRGWRNGRPRLGGTQKRKQ